MDHMVTGSRMEEKLMTWATFNNILNMQTSILIKFLFAFLDRSPFAFTFPFLALRVKMVFVPTFETGNSFPLLWLRMAL